MRHHTRNEELEEVSRELKALSREIGGPVVAASQLSRNVERRANKRPVMSDLRDSGAIESNADNVFMLYRPGKYDPSVPLSQMEVIAEKCRHGEPGTVNVTFGESTGWFRQDRSSKTSEAEVSENDGAGRNGTA